MTNKMAIRYLSPVKSLMKKLDFDRHYIEALDFALKNLKERPIGEWEFFSIGNNQYTRCSVCKDEHISEYTDLDWWYDNFKYCPKCGAFMMTDKNRLFHRRM